MGESRTAGHARPPARIAAVAPGSPAARAGLQPDEALLAVNGETPLDCLEYRFLCAEEKVRLTVADKDGRLRALTILKNVDEDLGVEFTEDLFDGLRTCRNRCVFCFVAQLPRGLRRSLYLRDDDYRMSFLHGNFLSLTNFTADDLARVTRMRLSPLYVSVHATDPEIRNRMLGRADAPPILEQMRPLLAAGVELHSQVVLCPGLNDGEVLSQTIADLVRIGAASIGIVPVGLSDHRQGLPALRAVGTGEARALVRQVHRLQREYRATLGRGFVYLADEIYLLAGWRLPPAPAYDGFPQLENGIGMARLFLNEVGRLRASPGRQPQVRTLTLITGLAGEPLVRVLADRLGMLGVQARVLPTENRLFGKQITVSGLLAGADVIRALAEDPERSEAVALPAQCLNEGRFLDDVTVEQVAEAAGRPVILAASPRDLWRRLCLPPESDHA